MDDTDLESRLRALRLVPPPPSLDARVAPARRRRWAALAMAAGIAALGGATAWWSLARPPAPRQAAPPAGAVALQAHAIQRSVAVQPLAPAVAAQVTTTRLLDLRHGTTATITQHVVSIQLPGATVY
jgi:hypothetical protein